MRLISMVPNLLTIKGFFLFQLFSMSTQQFRHDDTTNISKVDDDDLKVYP